MGKVEAVTDFTFLGSKITADSDCSCEIKTLAPWKGSYDQPRECMKKQSQMPSADEWIRKLWYIYTMEYYSAIKKNSFESVLMRWMKLEPIIE